MRRVRVEDERRRLQGTQRLNKDQAGWEPFTQDYIDMIMIMKKTMISTLLFPLVIITVTLEIYFSLTAVTG